MKIKPLRNNIAVQRIDDDKVTDGGIVIPDTTSEKPSRGIVIAVGKGKVLDNGKLIPIGVNVGTTILFRKDAGTEMTVDGDDFVMMTEDDVVAIVS